ncbi:MAG: XTP/dITP diphosphatase [bacterium]|nr:XTP/dITP diphosphatase [bacterium]
MKILLASRNKDKAKEIREKVQDLDIEILTPCDFPDLPEVDEDGETLEENAAKKGLELHRITHLPTLADDTGLEVDALGGAPGIYSARYAGPQATYQDNVDRLIMEMAGVPLGKRQARFRCVIAFVQDGDVNLFQGRIDGLISQTPSGNNGFGYDPVFFIPEKGKTLAELSLEEKNEISHRGRALAAWVEFLKSRRDKGI